MSGSDVDLIQRMDYGVAAMARASSEVLEAVGEFDERGLWEADGTSMTQWLAYRYSLTWVTANEWLRVARAVAGVQAPRGGPPEGCGRDPPGQVRIDGMESGGNRDVPASPVRGGAGSGRRESHRQAGRGSGDRR